MNDSLKSWINGKTKVATFVVRKLSTGHMCHHTGTGLHDTRPRRERTRNSQLRKAIKENF